MEKFNWDDKYSIGIKPIDFQHKYFLEIINRFVLSHRVLQEKNMIPDYQSELVAYAHFHFKSEENLMRLIGYPDFESHKTMHYELLNQINVYGYKAEESKENFDRLTTFLFGWFTKHTITEDKKIYEYIMNENPEIVDRLFGDDSTQND